MEKLTVYDLSKICKTNMCVMSGFNGKVLCKSFNPKKHAELAGREVIALWSEFRTKPISGYGNDAYTEICVYVHGGKEYDEFIKKGG